jgi:hypothetical protein
MIHHKGRSYSIRHVVSAKLGYDDRRLGNMDGVTYCIIFVVLLIVAAVSLYHLGGCLGGIPLLVAFGFFFAFWGGPKYTLTIRFIDGSNLLVSQGIDPLNDYELRAAQDAVEKAMSDTARR